MATYHAYNSVTYPYSKEKAEAAAFSIWSMDTTTGCPAYVTAKSAFFERYPDQAATLCRMCHLSLTGQLIQFVAQHFVVAACLYILWANRDLPAQRLRLGTYIPDYLGGMHVNVSVNAPIEGYKRNSSRITNEDSNTGGKKKGGGLLSALLKRSGKGGGEGGTHYARLPGGPEEGGGGGGGVEESKGSSGGKAVVIATGV